VFLYFFSAFLFRREFIPWPKEFIYFLGEREKSGLENYEKILKMSCHYGYRYVNINNVVKNLYQLLQGMFLD